MTKQKNTLALLVNTILLLSGIAMAFSGLLIQFNYHMGHHGNIHFTDLVMGLDYFQWSLVHKVSILIVTALVIYHITTHWRWYMGVLKKRLFSKHQQVLVFSILFIITAITGIVPWIVDETGGSFMLRKGFIEIHDKIALLLAIYLTLHLVKRFKWYVNYLKQKS